jgi:hypothetical protein
MGSTTRRRGVYGGEYAPTGLRLFAWWKKNGERRLHKPGSGSAEIRSKNLKLAAACTDPLYSGRVLQKDIGQRATYASQVPPRAGCWSFWWPAHAPCDLLSSQGPNRPGPKPACPSERAAGPRERCVTGPRGHQPTRVGHQGERARRWQPQCDRERARTPWPLRHPFFLLFFNLFLLNKYYSIFINSYN